MITAGATPTPKTIDQRRVALTSPQVKTLQTDNAGTLSQGSDPEEPVVQRAAEQAADSLQKAIVNVLWDPSGTGFSQGMRPEGRDTVDPLDINSWGSIFLDAIGQTDLATASLEHTSAFRISDSPITGYLAFRPQPAIPDPVPSVWFEGSFGVAFARARHGDVLGYNETLAGLRAAQRPDGSFPVATSADRGRDLTPVSAVAPTTWFILASRPNHSDSLWAAGSGAG